MPSPGFLPSLDTSVATPLAPSSLPSGVLLQDGFSVGWGGVSFGQKAPGSRGRSQPTLQSSFLSQSVDMRKVERVGCDFKADGNAQEQLLSTYKSQAHSFTRSVCI